MPGVKTEDGVAKLESFIKAAGGPAKEWYVGISQNAVGRLEQHGMQDNPLATWIQCEDENTARAIERHFLETGTQRDRGGGSPDKSPTQVYAFRAPKLTHFREWLKAQEKNQGEEKARRVVREEWVRAVTGLVNQCKAWLAESDPEGILTMRQTQHGKAEAGLGRYEVPVLFVEHQETIVQVVPVGRNTPRTIPLAPGVEKKACGRVDITNGITKHLLYRTQDEGRDDWYVLSGDEATAFNQDSFMAIMEDLLS